ncbi:UDP-glucose 4-epimerase GalE [Sandaracinomonas limnophila]|uniref:UDP-glucose 4-epimerase n=1 Tax=Sandaracinomonas limnophila TaxID=1862386 RepID=A0A437PW75_9BACT|nr:UDP-glucose 4-epimerase GalE [Sandaracinomonas limnophila]RVU26506.1 UDP-glucose 4-epimerase GalE [Sandaracinomonas limnophila]
MEVLITGGAGFIGSHTYVNLIENGYKPIILDNFSNSNKDVINHLQTITGQEVKFYTGDVKDANLLNQLFSENKIEGVIHFAADKAVGESVANPLKYYENNLYSTILLLKKMEEFGIKNFVFSSSCTVYGEPKELPVTENSPIQQAVSPYGNTKQICEEIIADTVKSNKGLKAIALRYFNPIGAHSSGLIGELPLGVPANLIPFLTQSVAGLRGPLQVFGTDYPTPDGSAIRDYIHVVDLAAAHTKALEYAAKQTENSFYDVFNIGTGKGSSVLEVILAFEKANNIKVKYEIKPRREGDITAVYADTSKSEKNLNWKANKSLEEALKDAWTWQKNITK